MKKEQELQVENMISSIEHDLKKQTLVHRNQRTKPVEINENNAQSQKSSDRSLGSEQHRTNSMLGKTLEVSQTSQPKDAKNRLNNQRNAENKLGFTSQENSNLDDENAIKIYTSDGRKMATKHSEIPLLNDQ